MPEKYQELLTHLGDIHNVNMAYWVLEWDQNTMMPPGGGEARAAQMAVLKRIRHEMLTSDKTARLLEEAEKEIDMGDYDSTEASMIRVAKEDYKHAIQLPPEFVQAYTQARTSGFEIWKKAKAANDYESFIPVMKRFIELKQHEAELRGVGDAHPYDIFLNHWEKGITTEQVQQIFADQKAALVELTAATAANQAQVDDSILHQHFDIAKQRELSQYVSSAFGFDYVNWARMDTAPHPFCLQVAKNDIRLTTRFREDFFNPAFYGTLHETGHGLHGHGFAEELDGTFLSDMESYSHAVCESQSRTWENLVGRSREFCEWVFPKLVEIFPDQFKDSSPEQFYKAVNKARPQFIRVEADELTYNLHIMLRFEVELDLVTGKVKVEDAPELWADKFDEYFGMRPKDHIEGILQDIHYALGGIGAYVGYALGNLLSVQYYNKALAAHPDIPNQVALGNFETLHTWLTENIYTHGRKYSADELTRRVTGESIQSRDFVAYLQKKFTDVYAL